MRSHRLAVAIGFIIAMWTIPTPSAAQSNRDPAAAEKLFDEAVPLMKNGQWDAAARKLEASLDYDPAFATAMNLATCYEQLGKLASAWTRYREAAGIAAQGGDTQSRDVARNKARALQTTIPRLVINVAEKARSIAGLKVTRGDQVVAAFGSEIYLDPGEVEIKATAPNHKDFTTRVTAVVGQTKTVEIPALEAIAEAQPPPEAPAEAPRDSPSSGRTRRILGWSGIGTGAAVVITGLGFGWSAISNWNDAIDSGKCDGDILICSPEGQKQTDKARLRATISNLMIGTGLILAAAGTYLVLTSPESGQSLQVVPAAGPESAGLSIMGRF